MGDEKRVSPPYPAVTLEAFSRSLFLSFSRFISDLVSRGCCEGGWEITRKSDRERERKRDYRRALRCFSLWFLRLPRDWLLPSLPPRLYTRPWLATRDWVFFAFSSSFCLFLLRRLTPRRRRARGAAPGLQRDRKEKRGEKEREKPFRDLPLIVFALAFKTF